MPQLAAASGLRPSAANEAPVVTFGRGRRAFRIPRQQREEMIEALRVELEAGRELPQERAELFLEPQHAGGEEIGEWRLYIIQLFEVIDEPAAFPREDKTLRGLVIPPGKRAGPLKRIMSAVDLD